MEHTDNIADLDADSNEELLQTAETPTIESNNYAVANMQYIAIIIKYLGNTDEKLAAIKQLRQRVKYRILPIYVEIKTVMDVLLECLEIEHFGIKLETMLTILGLAVRVPEWIQGAAGLLAYLLETIDAEFWLQALTVLQHMIGTCYGIRVYMLSENILMCLLALIDNNNATVDIMRIVAEIVLKLCNYNEPLAEQKVHELLLVLRMLLVQSDNDVIINAIEALYILKQKSELTEIIVESGIVAIVADSFKNDNRKVRQLALDIVCDMVFDETVEANRMLIYVPYTQFTMLLADTDKCIRLSALKVLYNITTSSNFHLEEIFANDLIKYILANLTHTEFEIQAQAAKLCKNLAIFATTSQALMLIENNILQITCNLLLSSNTEFLATILAGIYNICRAAPTIAVQVLVSSHCLQQIKYCQVNNSNALVSNLAKIILAHFCQQYAAKDKATTTCTIGLKLKNFFNNWK